MNIVLYFGSFNPIHRAHLAIADTLSSMDGIDELWLVVSPHNPLKLSSGLAAQEHRYAMAQLAVEELGLSERVRVSDVEFAMVKPSYTYHTLKLLRERYPDHRFSMVMGSDNLEQISLWYEYEQILSSTPIYLYPREGYNVEESLFEKYDITLLSSVQLMRLSSTDVREGRAGAASLTLSTIEYIERHRLYR